VLCLQSTVVNLLENFYAPQRGQILLDGTPLDAIDHEYLHSQISLVSQEPVLFAGTLVHTPRDCATASCCTAPPLSTCIPSLQ
jgi:ABC-type transport system involved in Fe-S cluster assembly fused permease/ATPase subunit